MNVKPWGDIEIQNVKQPSIKGQWKKCLAIFDFKMLNFLEIKSCKVMEGDTGIWIAYPSVKKGDEYFNTIWTAPKDPLAQSFKQELLDKVSVEMNAPGTNGLDDLPF